jgi:hypothetical protein
MNEFRRQKGVKHVLGHMGDSLNLVDSGIGERLHDGRIRSYPGGHRRHFVSNQTYSGTKNILAIWTLAGEGEVFGKGLVINRFTIKFAERSNRYEKEKYRYPLFSASYVDHHLFGLCIDTHT